MSEKQKQTKAATTKAAKGCDIESKILNKNWNKISLDVLPVFYLEINSRNK